MAGEWIKVEVATADKPEVLKIARILGIEQDAAFGKLTRLWAWFDSNSVDGSVDGAVDTDVDNICRQKGFAAACITVGWLAFDESLERLTLPNFERHNGETAKQRALKNRRQAKWRHSVDASASTCASTREEKRREEKKKEQKQKPCSSGDERERFETRFWPAYPRKQAKADAVKAFVKLAPDDAQLAAMLAALAVQKQSVQWRRDNGQFIPLAATWIRGERWSDKVEGDSAPESGFSMGMVL